MRITVFGATGQAGRHITRLLLQDGRIEVVGCARNADRLHEMGVSMDSAADRFHATALDVRDGAAALRAIAGADLVVGATSRWQDGPGLAAAAVRSGTSYLGIHLSRREKWTRLRRLRDDCVSRGVMVVDDGGAHPGLPAALVRWAAEDGPVSFAWVAAKFSLRWDELELSAETVEDFLAEIEAMDASFLRDGRWIHGYRHARKFDVDGSGDLDTCVPMCLEEIRELGNAGILPSVGFFIAGFGPVVDYGVLPLAAGLAKIRRRWAAGLLWRGLRRFGSSAPAAVLMLEAQRTAGAVPIQIRVSHSDPYFLTAGPVVVTAQQMLAKPRPGVWSQGMFVDPAGLPEKLQRMGLAVQEGTR